MLPEYLIIFPVLVYHIMNLYDKNRCVCHRRSEERLIVYYIKPVGARRSNTLERDLHEVFTSREYRREWISSCFKGHTTSRRNRNAISS